MPARVLPLLLICVAACGEGPPAPPASLPSTESRPDPGGVLTGIVRWHGTAPNAGPFRSIDEPLTAKPAPPARDWPNPLAPRITSGALADAVVLLRGVDPRLSRPWTHAPACVEMRDQRYHVVQDGDHRVGFVRPGDPVEFVSRDERLHVAQARGDAFFSIALPRPHAPRVRSFDSPGLVELTSGSGYFWMRAHLFVSDHPYLTRTDAAGRFRLDGVPAGEYDLVAWHPDWRVREEFRNPDLFRVQQVRFLPPLETSRRVRVAQGETCEVDVSLGSRQSE